jgi:hypothetical protein
LISLKIHHKTTYRFNKPVALGPHCLMLLIGHTIASEIPYLTPIADVSPRGAANRLFGPKPGIASFNSIDYDDRLIVASLF